MSIPRVISSVPGETGEGADHDVTDAVSIECLKRAIGVELRALAIAVAALSI